MYNQYGTYYPGYNQMYQNNMQRQDLTKVTGLEGARAYQMAPNSNAALFDSNNDVFYVKSTDGAGFPTIRAFSFKEINLQENHSNYVTRDEFNQLKTMIERIENNNGKFNISTQQSPTTEIPVNDSAN